MKKEGEREMAATTGNGTALDSCVIPNVKSRVVHTQRLNWFFSGGKGGGSLKGWWLN